MAIQTKAEAARQMRYKKSVAQGFNIDDIKNGLYDLISEMDEVRYYADGDIDELTEALDGDEEEAYEFRMMFSELSGEAEQLWTIIDDFCDSDLFDVFFAAVARGSVELLGYDSYQDDYYHMTSYEQELGEEEAGKKLQRMTKGEIIKAARWAFGVASAYLNISYKSNYLKASMDVLKGKNHAHLEVVKEIEKLYNAADEAGWKEWEKAVKDFDKVVNALPEKAWVE